VTDGFNRLYEIPNVLVSMPVLHDRAAEKNPTLTVMALAARSGGTDSHAILRGHVTEERRALQAVWENRMAVSEIGFGGARIGGLLAQEVAGGGPSRRFEAACDAGITSTIRRDMIRRGNSEIPHG